MISDTLDKLIDEVGDLVKQAHYLARMNDELLKKQKCKREEEPTFKDLCEMARYIVDTDDDVLGITIKVTKARKKVKDEDDDLIADLYGKDEEEGGEE